MLQCLAVAQQGEREEEERLVPWEGWARKGRCLKARPSWIQELGQKHPLAHTPVFQFAAVVVAVWEVVAVPGDMMDLVERSSGVLVAHVEARALGDQHELDPDYHADLEHADLVLADGQQRQIEKPDFGKAVDDLSEGLDAQVLVNHQDYVGMSVHVAKAVVGVVIVPLVQPVLYAERIAGPGVVTFDLKIRSLNVHLGFGDSEELLLAEASFVGYYYFGLVTCTAELVPPPPDGELVAEAKQAGGVLAFLGRFVSGLAQQGLLDGSQAGFDPEPLDVWAEEVWAVESSQYHAGVDVSVVVGSVFDAEYTFAVVEVVDVDSVWKAVQLLMFFAARLEWDGQQTVWVALHTGDLD